MTENLQNTSKNSCAKFLNKRTLVILDIDGISFNATEISLVLRQISVYGAIQSTYSRGVIEYSNSYRIFEYSNSGFLLIEYSNIR